MMLAINKVPLHPDVIFLSESDEDVVASCGSLGQD